jgi:dihydrofolate reductase
MRELTYFVATTADGFIGAPDGSADFLVPAGDVLEYIGSEYPETVPSHLRDRVGVTAANRHFDTVLQGRVSYQIALDAGITSPYAHARQFVFSRSLPTNLEPAVTIVASDPVETVRSLKAEAGLGLCLIGGARLAGALLPEIDQLLVKRYPVVAGAGLPMFAAEFAPAAFERVDVRTFDSGADFTRFRRTPARDRPPPTPGGIDLDLG